jgi:hypothetical protein
VRQTEGIFERWGFFSVVVSKFVPGFSTVAPPIAGALKMRQLSPHQLAPSPAGSSRGGGAGPSCSTGEAGAAGGGVAFMQAPR